MARMKAANRSPSPSQSPIPSGTPFNNLPNELLLQITELLELRLLQNLRLVNQKCAQVGLPTLGACVRDSVKHPKKLLFSPDPMELQMSRAIFQSRLSSNVSILSLVLDPAFHRKISPQTQAWIQEFMENAAAMTNVNEVRFDCTLRKCSFYADPVNAGKTWQTGDQHYICIHEDFNA